jgi:hypothetical protein
MDLAEKIALVEQGVRRVLGPAGVDPEARMIRLVAAAAVLAEEVCRVEGSPTS